MGPARPHDVMAGERRQDIVKESVSLDAKRAFPYGTYGQTRPGRTASSTAVPGVLLTRKGSQVQTLLRPPGTTHLSIPHSPPLVSRSLIVAARTLQALTDSGGFRRSPDGISP